MADDQWAEARQANGTFGPGGPGGPGRRKGSRSLNDAFRRILRDNPNIDVITQACETFGIPASVQLELELCDDQMEALAQICIYRAFTGSWEAFREVMDRQDPKPRVSQLQGPGGGPIPLAALTASVGAEGAQAAYAALLEAPAAQLEPGDED